MKVVVTFAAALATLMVITLYDQADAARTRKLASPINCHAPAAEGEVTLITVDVRSGRLFVDCQYAQTRPSKPRKGG